MTGISGCVLLYLGFDERAQQRRTVDVAGSGRAPDTRAEPQVGQNYGVNTLSGRGQIGGATFGFYNRFPWRSNGPSRAVSLSGIRCSLMPGAGSKFWARFS